jgi:AcrR family transcriptional regulator
MPSALSQPFGVNGQGDFFRVRKRLPTKASYHHGDLRRALLVAAVKLVEAKGPNGITLRAVAAKAGVTQTAPYRHFSNKQAMIDAVVEEGFSELEARLAAVADQAIEPLARLRQQAIAYAKFAVRRPGHYQLMFLSEQPAETVDENAPSAFQNLVDTMVDSIAEAQSARLIKNEPPLEIALSMWCLVHGLSTFVASKRLKQLNDSILETMVSKVMDNLLYGVSCSEDG